MVVVVLTKGQPKILSLVTKGEHLGTIANIFACNEKITYLYYFLTLHANHFQFINFLNLMFLYLVPFDRDLLQESPHYLSLDLSTLLS